MFDHDHVDVGVAVTQVAIVDLDALGSHVIADPILLETPVQEPGDRHVVVAAHVPASSQPIKPRKIDVHHETNVPSIS